MLMPSIVTVPGLGSSRPTTIFATLDMPEPDSPTRANVSCRAMSNDTSCTAFSNFRSSPSMTMLGHRLRRRSCYAGHSSAMKFHENLPDRL
jgi:hypothetical protein